MCTKKIFRIQRVWMWQQKMINRSQRINLFQCYVYNVHNKTYKNKNRTQWTSKKENIHPSQASITKSPYPSSLESERIPTKMLYTVNTLHYTIDLKVVKFSHKFIEKSMSTKIAPYLRRTQCIVRGIWFSLYVFFFIHTACSTQTNDTFRLVWLERQKRPISNRICIFMYEQMKAMQVLC